MFGREDANQSHACLDVHESENTVQTSHSLPHGLVLCLGRGRNSVGGSKWLFGPVCLLSLQGREGSLKCVRTPVQTPSAGREPPTPAFTAHPPCCRPSCIPVAQKGSEPSTSVSLSPSGARAPALTPDTHPDSRSSICLPGPQSEVFHSPWALPPHRGYAVAF